jgi:hypothetical protein
MRNSPIHLTGEVRNSSTTPTAEACCAACGRLASCMGFSFCAGPGACVDGNDTSTPVAWQPGACLLKSWWRPSGWPTSHGCGGSPGQPWRSGMNPNYYATFAYYPPPCEKGTQDAGLPAGPVPGVPGGVVGELWAGSVVALDLDSWALNQAGPMGSPPILNAFQCAYECESRYGRDGANAFAFCDAVDGCGSGCAAAARVVAPIAQGGRGDTRLMGPFSRKGCADGGGGGAAAAPSSADRWAHHLCQCRRVKNVKRAEAVPAGEGGGAGWVSGPTVKRPVY